MRRMRAAWTALRLRHPADVTDAEWALVAPLIRPAKRCGRSRTVEVREVLNAILHVLSSGCQWAALPKELAPKSTVWGDFSCWDWKGMIARLHHALCVAVRDEARREASPTTASIGDRRSQPDGEGGAKGVLQARPVRLRRRQEGGRPQARRRGRPGRAGRLCRWPSGTQLRSDRRLATALARGDPVLRLPGRAAQDRDGAEKLLRQAWRRFPSIARLIGDAGHQGPQMAAALARTGHWRSEIVRRSDRHRLVVLAKRWILERTIAWIGCDRRLAREFARECRIAAAPVHTAMVRSMLRGLAETDPA
jgi:transposase